MKHLRFIIVFCITLFFTTAFTDEGKDESGKGRGNEGKKYSEKQYRENKGDGKSYFHEHGYTRLNIPRGHYPPPGECRIWFPDRSPGQQPPPVKCGDPVPAGAWLIQHPSDIPSDHVTVSVYEPQSPGVIQAVGEFEIGSGIFVRDVFNK